MATGWSGYDPNAIDYALGGLIGGPFGAYQGGGDIIPQSQQPYYGYGGDDPYGQSQYQAGSAWPGSSSQQPASSGYDWSQYAGYQTSPYNYSDPYNAGYQQQPYGYYDPNQDYGYNQGAAPGSSYNNYDPNDWENPTPASPYWNFQRYYGDLSPEDQSYWVTDGRGGWYDTRHVTPPNTAVPSNKGPIPLPGDGTGSGSGGGGGFYGGMSGSGGFDPFAGNTPEDFFGPPDDQGMYWDPSSNVGYDANWNQYGWDDNYGYYPAGSPPNYGGPEQPGGTEQPGASAGQGQGGISYQYGQDGQVHVIGPDGTDYGPVNTGNQPTNGGQQAPPGMQINPQTGQYEYIDPMTQWLLEHGIPTGTGGANQNRPNAGYTTPGGGVLGGGYNTGPGGAGFSGSGSGGGGDPYNGPGGGYGSYYGGTGSAASPYGRPGSISGISQPPSNYYGGGGINVNTGNDATSEMIRLQGTMANIQMQLQNAQLDASTRLQLGQLQYSTQMQIAQLEAQITTSGQDKTFMVNMVNAGLTGNRDANDFLINMITRQQNGDSIANQFMVGMGGLMNDQERNYLTYTASMAGVDVNRDRNWQDLILGQGNLGVAQATQQANQAYQQGQLAYNYAALGETQANNAANRQYQMAQLVASLRGPRDAYAQQNVLYGMNPATGGSYGMEALTNGNRMAGFQAPQANPMPVSLQSFSQDTGLNLPQYQGAYGMFGGNQQNPYQQYQQQGYGWSGYQQPQQQAEPMVHAMGGANPVPPSLGIGEEPQQQPAADPSKIPGAGATDPYADESWKTLYPDADMG